MDKLVRLLFNDNILAEACRAYDIQLDDLILIGGFQNFVYEYKRNHREYILRFTHSSHRSTEILEAELEWLLHLSDNGVSVSKPIYSAHGGLFEVIDIGTSYFIVSSFEKAHGKRIGYPECLYSIDLYEKCGIITGQMHRLAKTYNPRTRRHDWQQNYYLQNITKFIPPNQILILESLKDLKKSILNLDQDQESYGLIHGDINVGNFLVDHDSINLFDFDECQYSWFVEDIAIQLYYLVYVFGDDNKEERYFQYQRFMEHFLKGYAKEHTISDSSLKQIPFFLRLREIIVYTGMYRSLDMSNLNIWTQDYLSQSKVRIENGISIIEFN